MKLHRPHLLNIPHHICEHLVGEHHGPGHRMIAGVCVMCVGVSIAKAAVLFHFAILHYLLDMLGYAVHGIGLIPFAEHILKNIQEE